MNWNLGRLAVVTFAVLGGGGLVISGITSGSLLTAVSGVMLIAGGVQFMRCDLPFDSVDPVANLKKFLPVPVLIFGGMGMLALQSTLMDQGLVPWLVGTGG